MRGRTDNLRPAFRLPAIPNPRSTIQNGTNGSNRNPLPHPHLRPTPRRPTSASDVKLAGWVHNYRDHGELVLIDLRDRDGLTQVVFDVDECGQATHDEARRLRSEWVVSVDGVVADRGIDEKGKSRENPKLATGKVEVRVKKLKVLSESPTPPFTPDEHETVNEEKRLASTATSTCAATRCRRRCARATA